MKSPTISCGGQGSHCYYCLNQGTRAIKPEKSEVMKIKICERGVKWIAEDGWVYNDCNLYEATQTEDPEWLSDAAPPSKEFCDVLKTYAEAISVQAEMENWSELMEREFGGGK